MNRRIVAFFLLSILFFIVGCSKESSDQKIEKEDVPYSFREAKEQVIDHLYGIGFPGNDDGLYIASNTGLKILSPDGWMEGSTRKHEYIGFQAVKEGFISSGAPEKNTGAQEPFGIVKSVDKGASLKRIAFHGEGPFPFLSAGYETLATQF